MTERENATLPETETETGEEDMPAEIVCLRCDTTCTVEINRHISGEPPENIHAMRTCRVCGDQAVFTLRGNAVTFMPGELFKEDLHSEVRDDVKELFGEALRCLFGQSGRGTVALARACVEQALELKGIKNWTLQAKISDAEGRGLPTQQVTLASGTKLLADDTLHNMLPVSQGEAMAVLNVTIGLVNYISQWQPASQSETSSNG